jgi:hypothetical protein
MTPPYDPLEELDTRDPDPPTDEEPEPIDLDAIEEAYRACLGESLILGSNGVKVLDAVPALLSRLRVAESELVRWKALPVEHRYGVAVGGDQTPDACGLFLPYPTAEAAREAAHGDRSTAYIRTLTLSPWERLDDAPF